MNHPRVLAFLCALIIVAAVVTACDSNSTPAAPSSHPYSVSGTVTYTGSLATVGSTRHLAVELKSAANFTVAGGDLYMQSASNGVAYAVNPYTVGTYYLVAFFGALNLPCELPSTGNTPLPRQGDPYYLYNGSSCTAATALTITSGQPSAAVSISFDDTCLFKGVSGNLNYTGSHGVSSTHGLVVALYQDAAYANLDGLAYVYLTCNNTTYNVATDSASSEYLLAFLDLAGTGIPATGDPCVKFGSVTPTTTLSQDLAFGDSILF